MTKSVQLRVSWIPNPPREAFYVPVEGLVDAIRVLQILTNYDNYLGDDLIVANVGFLEVFDGTEWLTWCDDAGDDIDTYKVDETGDLVKKTIWES